MNKLIFIDDCQLDQFILKRVLLKFKLSYEVSCTDDAQEVLSFLSQNRLDIDKLPDIILLDIYMPHFNGWDFLEKLQNLYPKLIKPFKIYILSASINPKDIARSKQYAFVNSFLFKPITNEVMAKLIRLEAAGMA